MGEKVKGRRNEEKLGVIDWERCRSKELNGNLLFGKWFALHELRDLLVEIVSDIGYH